MKKHKKIVILFLLKLLLDFSYYYYLNPNYEYMGFTFELNFIKLFESYILLIIIGYCLPNKEVPSNIAANILNLIMILPLLSIYGLKNEPRVYIYTVFFSFILLILLINYLPRLSIKFKLSLNPIVYIILFSITVIVYILLLFFNGTPSFEVFNFNNIYVLRDDVNYGFPFMIYLVSWQGTIINVFLMILAVYSNKKNAFLFYLILQILLYMLTGHKTFLFYPILLFILIKFLKRDKSIKELPLGNINIIILIMSLVAISFALISYFIKLNPFIPSLIISRVFFLPAQISFQYYEFFSENGYIYLSHSIFSGLFTTPIYTQHPILLIGERYYNDNWPNTGYIGDAYMNFGIIGVFIFTFLLAIILILIDSLSQNEFRRVVSSAFIVLFMFPLSNMGLLTSLLTGGLLLYILILLLYKEKELKIKF